MGRRLPGFLVLLFGMAFAVYADAPHADELDPNRRLLEEFKKDKAHYERLRASLQEFLALPRARQESLRQLVRDLNEESPENKARLVRVLENYADWLTDLPATDRQSVENAKSRDERLRVIQQIREREWIAGLPKKTQDDLQKLSPELRATRLAQLRKHDADIENQWKLALKYWDGYSQWHTNMPWTVQKELENYVEGSLKPMLNAQELQRLEACKDKYPQYPLLLVELERKHPITLPGPSVGPKHFKELPAEIRKQLPPRANPDSPKLAVNLAKTDGRWPQYAIAVSNLAANSNIKLAVQLGPSGPKDKQFSPAMQQFIEKKLVPVLTPKELEELKKAEGHWPLYPRKLGQLASSHSLAVPGMRLPGPSMMWQPFRRGTAESVERLPALDDQVLKAFADSGPSAEDRKRLPAFSLTEPVAREAWTREYFVRHPEELKSRQKPR